MRTVVEENLSVGWLVSQIKPPQRSATFCVKGTFRLQPGQPAAWADEPEQLSGDRFADDDPQKALYYPSDFAPFKPRGEALLQAVAHAPGGVPAPAFPIRLQVGALSKVLTVSGDRKWEHGLLRSKIGASQPIVSVPVSYDRAWGGPESARNPLGRGRGTPELPNLELPGVTPTVKADLDPAGFAPLHPQWQQRRALVGTYDDDWRKQRWPWFPKDFDWGFFNAAPRDQQLPGYLVGDEPLTFENLHPQQAVYQARLPGLRARCCIEDRLENGKPRFREVPLQLDTLWIDLTAEKLILVWRGLVDVRTMKFEELEYLFVFTEPLRTPAQSPEAYRAMMLERIALEEEEEPEEPEPPEEPDTVEQEMAAFEAERIQLEAHAAKVEAEKAAELAALGIAVPAEMPSMTLAEARQALAKELERVRAFPADQQAVVADFEAALADMDEMAKLEQEMEAATADEEPQTRETVVAAIAAKESLAKRELEGLDLSGLNLAGQDLSGASMAKANLSRTNLAGAKLVGTDLSEANLTEADLTGAMLDDADLTEAILTKARLQRLSLAAATLEKANLVEADLSGARGAAADFSGANLTKACLIGAIMPQADFTEAILEGANLVGIDLTAAQCWSTKARGVNLEGAKLARLQAGDQAVFAGANLRRIDAPGSIWEDSILDQADLSNGQLAGAQFAGASLLRTVFDQANLIDAVFDDAKLMGAVLSHANLLRASFERADLTEANVRGANCYEAGFLEAVTTKTIFHGANLKETLLVGR